MQRYVNNQQPKTTPNKTDNKLNSNTSKTREYTSNTNYINETEIMIFRL